MAYENGGDPMRGLKWCRKTPDKVAKELRKAGIEVSGNTVARLLKKLMGYSLRVNHKKVESGNRNPPKPKERDRQFQIIGYLRNSFTRQGYPVVSVDAKKKEYIGNFKNGGTAWANQAEAVLDHDFPSDAEARIVPYGIYDTQTNHGYVCIGTTAETPAFAVDAIERWWVQEGQAHYPGKKKMLILADCGGGNSSRSRVFKYRLQKQLCDTHGLTVRVGHYPPGSSKWNPIEHRLFSAISKNWAGKPLRTLQTALNYIRRTKTETGLRVKAVLVRKNYEKGEKISQTEMDTVRIYRPKLLPDWNYTIRPLKKCEIIVT
jgi:hypothetical protein